MKQIVLGMLTALAISGTAFAEKNILAFVDVQNDFIDGSLAVGYDNWSKAYENLEKFMESKKFDTYIFTRDNHPANHCSFKEEGGIWPAHCVKNTAGSEIFWKLTSLYNQKNTVKIMKGENKAVEEYGVDLLSYKKAPKDEECDVYVTGLCYDYCVSECAKMTAKAHPKARVHIVKPATVAIDPAAVIDFSEYPNIDVITE
ncbi:isochorismatase family protein [Treponema sp.]|uniref:isochorismatase family protein n=1 Tax=Treponema sp. TaxID=166 RepID=UPI0025E08B38|nr:isochorismatase family protein [Treponema sp.]MCR5218965.1 isochorismatase family protein [Treponema sp.]